MYSLLPALKVVMVGPPNVGKTAIVSRLNGKVPSLFSESTIGCSFTAITTSKCCFSIWDTAGQERFMALGPMYYRNANLAIFVFDVSDPRSIIDLTEFIYNFFAYPVTGTTETQIIFVGNKMDLDHPSESSLIDQIRNHPQITRFNLDLCKIVFVSALQNINIDVLLETMIDLGLKTIPKPLEDIISVQEIKSPKSKCQC